MFSIREYSNNGGVDRRNLKYREKIFTMDAPHIPEGVYAQNINFKKKEEKLESQQRKKVKKEKQKQKMNKNKNEKKNSK